MYNTILGALPLQDDGRAFYYSDFGAPGQKRYISDYPSRQYRDTATGKLQTDDMSGAKWPCCSGTLPQIAADYRISAYFRDKKGIYLNLFIPSNVRWKQDGVPIELAQSSSYPLEDDITIDVTVAQPVVFALRLRIPQWCQTARVGINGTLACSGPQAGNFLTITREWKTGDRVELTVPQKLALGAIDNRHPNVVAPIWGPMVLFAISETMPQITRQSLQMLQQSSAHRGEWSLGESMPITWRPWWSINNEKYFTYIKV